MNKTKEYQLAKKDIEIENLRKQIKELKRKLRSKTIELDYINKNLNELH